MGRIPKPWYWEERGKWFVTLDGVRHDLGPNEEQAQRQFHTLMASRGQVGPGPVSLGTVVDGYLAYLLRNAKPETHRIARWSLAPFPDVQVDKLTPELVEQWMQPDWKPGTERSVKIWLLASLNWAVKRKIIPINPLKGLPMPAGVSRGQEAIIKPESWSRLLVAISDECFRDLVTALKLTGARPSEVTRVTASDFDEAAGAWTLEEHKTAKKTGRKRVILLVPEMILLSRKLAIQHPTGPLFRNSWGNPWERSKVTERLLRLSKKLGVRLMAYSFRHTFATELLQAGVPDHDVAALLGHRGTEMLHKHYSHLLNNTQRLRETLSAKLPRLVQDDQTEAG